MKLTDVNALRRLAAQADPDQAPTIRDSLATAWQLAADPFQPLHSIPAIDVLRAVHPVAARVTAR